MARSNGKKNGGRSSRHARGNDDRLLGWTLVFGALALMVWALLYYKDDSALSNLLPRGMMEKETLSSVALPGTMWVWMHTDFKNGASIRAPGGDSFVLAFGTDRRLTSTTDCNSVFGDYSTFGDALFVGPLASTKIYCGPAALESEYRAELSRAAAYAASNQTLRLQLRDDTGVMHFARRQ